MTYTTHTRTGTVTRDSDGLVVAPAQGHEPEYLQWVEWCAAGGVPNVDDGESLEEAQARAIEQIDAMAYAAREALVAGTHPAEMSSWGLKLAESNQGGGPLLYAEAQARGITMPDLISKVQKNAVALAMAEAGIAGAAGRHRDSVRALTSIEDVLAYNFAAGWPTA